MFSHVDQHSSRFSMFQQQESEPSTLVFPRSPTDESVAALAKKAPVFERGVRPEFAGRVIREAKRVDPSASDIRKIEAWIKRGRNPSLSSNEEKRSRRESLTPRISSKSLSPPRNAASLSIERRGEKTQAKAPVDLQKTRIITENRSPISERGEPTESLRLSPLFTANAVVVAASTKIHGPMVSLVPKKPTLARSIDRAPVSARRSVAKVRQQEVVIERYSKSTAKAPASSRCPESILENMRFKKESSPQKQFLKAFREAGPSKESVKPENGSVGVTRFVAGYVVKSEDRGALEREILFGSILRHLGVAAPEAAFAKEAKDEMSSLKEFSFDSSESGESDMILMTRVPGRTFGQVMTDPCLMESFRDQSSSLFEQMGRMAMVDLLTGNADRLISLDLSHASASAGLREENCINLGNIMAVVDGHHLQAMAAIDNAGFLPVIIHDNINEASVANDLSLFQDIVKNPHILVDHIISGLCRDLAYFNITGSFRRAEGMQNFAREGGLDSLAELRSVLQSPESFPEKIQTLYAHFLTLQDEADESAALSTQKTPAEMAGEIRANFANDRQTMDEILVEQIHHQKHFAPLFQEEVRALLTALPNIWPSDSSSVALQEKILIKHLGFSSVDKMKESLLCGVQDALKEMADATVKTMVGELAENHRDFSSDNLFQLEHIQNKLSCLAGSSEIRPSQQAGA